MLAQLLEHSARHTPDAVAVQAPDGVARYGDLDALADRVAHVLHAMGVRRGDRVAVWHEKSIATIAAFQGALRIGAAYVPVDPLSPVLRASKVMSDCAVRALVTTQRRAVSLPPDQRDQVPVLSLDEAVHGGPTWKDVRYAPRDGYARPRMHEDDLAYILYTSGSTGQPKGVCISQRNALAFIQWAADLVGVTSNDSLANHAGFHFDLSVFDLYAAFYAGAKVSLVPEREAFLPTKLVEFVANQRINIWYSVPSALVLMMDQGGLLAREDVCLRAIVFAGEPFPMKSLRKLQQRFSMGPGAHTRLLNFYGPTETNVCSYHEVDHPLPADMSSIPIGTAASGDRVWARTVDGSKAAPGEQGELYVDGPTVMLGYWGHPPQAGRPYATGDLVRLDEEGKYQYLGRRDHMVKVHGHRIELGEIENALALHPLIQQAAVVVSGSGIHARLVAFMVCDAKTRPSLIEVKAHCARHVLRHMIVDRIHYLPGLPQTANGKVDRIRLLHWLENDPTVTERGEAQDGSRDHAEGTESIPDTGGVGRH